MRQYRDSPSAVTFSRGRVALPPERAVYLAELLRAVAHPLRLRIICLLDREELQVGELAERLDVNQPLVSQALSILRMNRLVAATRHAGTARYRLIEPALHNLLSCIVSCGKGQA